MEISSREGQSSTDAILLFSKGNDFNDCDNDMGPWLVFLSTGGVTADLTMGADGRGKRTLPRVKLLRL
jgi:hypothetical protein